MTHAEHADRVHKTLKAVHRALAAHHLALAAYAAEHGAGVGIGDETMQAAIVPKDPPGNPGRE